MKIRRTTSGELVQRGSGNVYRDLGYRDADAMLIKARLVTKIGEIIAMRKLTQTEAAHLLGLTQPKISDLLNGRFRGISEHRLLECLTKLGQDIEIRIRPASGRSVGKLRLSVA
jgi:predicted XRE-type DNA-binding protein